MPCGSCVADFLAIQTADPLPADVAQQFAATVRWHNAVNRSIGKPEVAESDALEIYRPGGTP
jgi:hypothetical protein